MNSQEAFKKYLSYSNNSFLYFHMALLSLLVIMLQPEEETPANLLFFTLALGGLLYGLFQSGGYRDKIKLLQVELKNNGTWYDSYSGKIEPLSFKEYLLLFPKRYAEESQIIGGILLFAYYLYMSEGIPSSLFDSATGWISFISVILAIIVLIMIMPAIFHMESATARQKWMKIIIVLKPVYALVSIVGLVPFVAIVIHILSRIIFDPEIDLGYRFFPSNTHFYVLAYLTWLNGFVFERLMYRYGMTGK